MPLLDSSGSLLIPILEKTEAIAQSYTIMT